jgi:hypothetical protein
MCVKWYCLSNYEVLSSNPSTTTGRKEGGRKGEKNEGSIAARIAAQAGLKF